MRSLWWFIVPHVSVFCDETIIMTIQIMIKALTFRDLLQFNYKDFCLTRILFQRTLNHDHWTTIHWRFWIKWINIWVLRRLILFEGTRFSQFIYISHQPSSTNTFTEERQINHTVNYLLQDISYFCNGYLGHHDLCLRLIVLPAEQIQNEVNQNEKSV